MTELHHIILISIQIALLSLITLLFTSLRLQVKYVFSY